MQTLKFRQYRPSSAFICIHSYNMDTSSTGGSLFRLGGSAEEQRPLISARHESLVRINRRADRTCMTMRQALHPLLRLLIRRLHPQHHHHPHQAHHLTPRALCAIHLTETQDCDDDDKNLYGNVVMKDNNKKHNRSNRQRQRPSQWLRHERW